MREFVRIFDNCFNGLVVADFECFSYDGGNLAYDFPNSLTDGQFHSVLTDILEQSSDCLVIGESLGRGEYVVLKEGDGGMCNLSREVARLTFAEAKILLAILEYHFDRPTHCINLICFVEVKGSVCGKDATPWRIFAATHIKQAHSHIFNESVHDNIMTAMPTAVLHALGVGGTLADYGFGRKLVTILVEGESHALFAHFNHAEIVTFDSSCLDEPNYFLAGKPTVSQKIIKPISAFDGSADHIFEQFYLALGVILHSFDGSALLVALLYKTPVKFFRRHGMIAILSRLSDEFKVNHQLTLSVTNGKCQRFESKHHLMCDMAENAANLLGMDAPLGIICIINNETDRVAGMIDTDRNLVPELSRDMAHYLTPVKTIVVDKPIKHILRGAT